MGGLPEFGLNITLKLKRSGWLAALLVAALFWGNGALAQACSPGSVFLRGSWGQTRFAVELAQTDAERRAAQLAELAGVNAAKARKDLSYLGSYGTRGVG